MFIGLVGSKQKHAQNDEPRQAASLEAFRIIQHYITGSAVQCLCVCDSSTPAKALWVGFSGSKLIYYSKNSLAPELLINRTAAAQSVTAELHNSHWREERRKMVKDIWIKEWAAERRSGWTLQTTKAQLAWDLLMQFKTTPLPFLPSIQSQSIPPSCTYSLPAP